MLRSAMYIDSHHFLLLFFPGLFLLWLVLGNNNLVIAQEFENRSHVSGEGESIPYTLASLSHDADNASVRQIEWASTYAVPVRLINDDIDVSNREKFRYGSYVGVGSYGDKYILGEAGKCDGSSIFNIFGTESQPPSTQIWQTFTKEGTLHCFADGYIDGCVSNAIMKLKPSDFRPLWVRNVNYGKAVCARPFVSIPFEVVVNYVSGGDETTLVINKESCPHNLLDADSTTFIGPGSASDWDDGFFDFHNGLNKSIGLGLGLGQTEKTATNDGEADYPHIGTILVHSLISDNCHLAESGDSAMLRCDDLATH
jgi:hypothetical protein